MIALWFALLTGGPPPASIPPSPVLGRIYTSPTVHVGIRGHAFASPFETGVGVTVQVSTMLL